MFTKIDKAIVALIMSLLFLFSSNGVAIPDFLNESYVTNAVAMLTPFIIWLIPNKKDQ